MMHIYAIYPIQAAKNKGQYEQLCAFWACWRIGESKKKKYNYEATQFNILNSCFSCVRKKQELN